MSNTPHTLGEEFLTRLSAIHALKSADPKFARILEEYDFQSTTVFIAPKPEFRRSAKKRKQIYANIAST